jgi:hypothetical protein
MGTPQMSERLGVLANKPSLKRQTLEALEQNSKRLENVRKQGEAWAKALKDAEETQLRGSPIEEESEAESSSSSGTDSDSGNESSSEGDSSNDVEMGGMETPGSVTKAKPKAQKPDISFSQLSKKFSLAGSRR